MVASLVVYGLNLLHKRLAWDVGTKQLIINR